ncbi:hypothetical protein [Microbacterium sp. AG238]|uniref:hypothetical protein n=1 Tax=Microbacterium sp. AG238 TaxID=2183994 RepID=UPI000E750607|nr:hypothetical protein [Microbacterium sp. AG238]RKE60513.1 hypothetical protein DEU36_2956 [Microbacterium sp. AG238]
MTTDTTTETIGERRLREAREAVAALDTSTPTTTASAVASVQPGDVVHSLDEGGIAIARSVNIFGQASVILRRGDELVVDEEMIDASRDRHGNVTWPALVLDEAAQIEKWGTVRLRAGRAPADLRPWTHGSALWRDMRERARREAHALPTAEARADALAQVERVYGAAPSTATTLNKAPDPSVRAAEEQRARIAASGVRSSSTYAPRERGGYSEGRE